MFDVCNLCGFDIKRGNRFCPCGAEQNKRSLDSQEEEHRSFKDNTTDVDKRRTKVSKDGRSGGNVGEASLQRAHQIATAGAEGENRDLQKKEQPGKGAPAAKRARPENFLDNIMGNVKKLHSAKPLTRGGANDDGHEVASHYLLPPRQSSGPCKSTPNREGANSWQQQDVCNLCGRKAEGFEVDMRRGDRLCLCGAVQNKRSLESQEEEHRSFKDDTTGVDKRRTEVSKDGRSGGNVGEASLQRAHQIATAGAEGENGDLQEKEQKRVDSYRDKAKSLAGIMELNRIVIDLADHSCQKLVQSQVEHDKRCPDQSCYMRRIKEPYLMAAGVIKYALRKNKMDRPYQVIAEYLERDEYVKVTGFKVGRACILVEDHLRAYDANKYPWCEGASQGEEGSSSAEALMEVKEAEEQGDDGPRSSQYTSLLPRMCNSLNLPYMVEVEARELIEEWVNKGMRALMPQTIASCAILEAHKACAQKLIDAGFPPAVTEQKEILTKLAKISGVTEETIRRGLKERDVKPPPAQPPSSR